MKVMNKSIIYIIGSGRSGTTLLDIVLGNEPSFFSAGELNRYAKRLGKPHDPRDENVSKFWGNIEREVNADFSKVKPITDKLEYHSGFIKQLFVSKENKKCYESYNLNLFKSIGKNVDADYIIDSSKYPMRGHYLSKIFGNNISYVYIQRNPNDIVESFQNKKVEQPSKSRVSAHLYLFIVNKLSSIVVRKLRKTHKVVTISYSELVNSPLCAFDKIEKHLEIELSELKNICNKKDEFKVGYLFDGNRLRLNNSITIKPSIKKKTKHLINTIMYPVHKMFWYN